MKTLPIAKILGTATLMSLALMAGTSQADPYGYQARPNAPEFNRPALGPGFGHGQRMHGMSIDQRQNVLMARIDQGLRNGRLTRSEARDLTQDMRRIEWLERRFERDRRLDRGEWQELDRLLDKLARNLREDLRDDDRRGPGWGGRGYAWR